MLKLQLLIHLQWLVEEAQSQVLELADVKYLEPSIFHSDLVLDHADKMEEIVRH